MVAVVHSSTLLGVEARPVEVETELTLGLPFFSLIGLGDTAVQEARYRIQAALRASNLELPHKRITVNLAPAAIRKDGAALDLPMALGLLVAAGHVPEAAVADAIVIGELALSGSIRPVRGALSVAALAKARNVKRVIVPRVNGAEAACVPGVEVLAPSTLLELVQALRGEICLETPMPGDGPAVLPSSVDLREVRGQDLARRALELAAAGAHNLLFVGNPGCGKTMLARRLPTILPKLSSDEQIEVTTVWSAAGLTIGGHGLITERPFRAPHHTVSEAGLIGGGSTVRPGEISLAHHGVLFLDEMPEFPRRVLESLRQPLEDRSVSIARARHTVRLPADFMLVGAANPCPCGWLGHSSSRCICTIEEVSRYGSRLSGALLDRIDLVVETPSVGAAEILSGDDGEASAAVRARVARTRIRMLTRFGRANGRVSAGLIKADLSSAARTLLERSFERLGLSARSLDRALRVGRTIADLEGSAEIQAPHLAEALRYRRPGTWAQEARAAAGQV